MVARDPFIHQSVHAFHYDLNWTFLKQNFSLQMIILRRSKTNFNCRLIKFIKNIYM